MTFHLDLSTLNPPQLLAVQNIHGPYMLLAGAGTGKTSVITKRIAYMVQQKIPPQKIVAVTFTNKAAKEMKERVSSLVGATLAREIFIGTFHSYCLSLLRRHHHAAGLHKEFSIIGVGDQIELVRKSLEEKKWNGLFQAEEVHRKISSAKNNLLMPNEMTHKSFSGEANVNDINFLRIIYELYEQHLKFNRVIDFDDCILKTAKLLEKNDSVLHAVQNSHQFFMVDEYQDTNFSQLRILELIASASKNICVVGDDDQSIYSWRGALTETIDMFGKIFPGSQLIKLEQNYRCTNIILSAANTVIKNNPGRTDKTLWSNNNQNEKITLASLKNDQEEAEWIAKKCLSLLGKGFQPNDIGILYRANTQTKALEFSLRELNLNYKVYGGSSFFEKKEVKDFLSYLKLCFNKNERLAFFRIINTPPRGVGIKTLEKIEQKSIDSKQSPYHALKNCNLSDLPSTAQKGLHDFLDKMNALSTVPINNKDDLETLGKTIISKFKLEDDIRQKTSDAHSQRKKIDSLRKIPLWLKVLAENSDEIFLDGGEFNPQSLLDRLSFLEEPDTSKKDSVHSNHISLMTIHGAKGLEFPIVFVCGLEEELLPHRNSLDSALGVEEERRLFYVALTRAKKSLFLSYCNERSSIHQLQTRRPSRFLKEIPAHILEVNSAPKEESGELKKQRNLAGLGLLKSKIKLNFS